MIPRSSASSSTSAPADAVALRVPARLSGLRLAGDARGQRKDRQGRFAPPLYRRTGVRRTGRGTIASLRVTRRDGHRRPRRGKTSTSFSMPDWSRPPPISFTSSSSAVPPVTKALAARTRGAGQAARGRFRQDAQERARGVEDRNYEGLDKLFAAIDARRDRNSTVSFFALGIRPYRRDDRRLACQDIFPRSRN